MTVHILAPSETLEKNTKTHPMQVLRRRGTTRRPLHPARHDWEAVGDPQPQAVATLHLLDGFELEAGERSMPVGPAGQRLLALLACNGRCGARRRIAQVLWPDLTDSRCQANLRTALYRMQRRTPGVVAANHSEVWMCPGVLVDLAMVTHLADELMDSPSPVDPRLQSASALTALTKDVLPGWDEEWLVGVQSRHRQLRLDALESLSRLLSCHRQHGRAVQAALAAVSADPLRETAHETLIRAYLTQGNRHDAISHYQTYRALMQEELGLDPPMDLGQLLWGDP